MSDGTMGQQHHNKYYLPFTLGEVTDPAWAETDMATGYSKGSGDFIFARRASAGFQRIAC